MITGKRAEFWRWLAAIVGAAIVSYFTSQAEVDKRITTVETTEQNHFNEVLRRLEIMQGDIREIRTRGEN